MVHICSYVGTQLKRRFTLDKSPGAMGAKLTPMGFFSARLRSRRRTKSPLILAHPSRFESGDGSLLTDAADLYTMGNFCQAGYAHGARHGHLGGKPKERPAPGPEEDS